ncbi:MAG: RagB/SusD family nutrient uptake outer membrane protein [Prevotella sp.]|jgi:hypothetical protein
MKSTKYIALVFGTAAFVFAGCSDSFLDKTPDERVEITTPTKCVQLLNTSYPESNYGWICEISSDNIADNNAPHYPSSPNAKQIETHYNLGTYDRTDDEMYRFEPGVSSTSQDTPTHLWNVFYSSIHSVNYVLEAIDKGNVNDDESGYDLDVAAAEAKLIRAYDHFILVNVFCQAYKDSVASKNDLGIPYVTVPETNTGVKYDRSNVAETYNKIQQDLEEGLAGISDANYKTAPKYHFNINAAHAFAARFYLFKRDYAKVIEHANYVLGTDSATIYSQLMDWAPFDSCSSSTDYAKVWQDYSSSNNLMILGTYSAIFRHSLGYRFALVGQPARDVLFHSHPMWSGYVVNPAALVGGYLFWSGEDYGYSCAKIAERFQYVDRLAGTGYVHTMRREFTRAELLLERAEAEIMLGQYDAAFKDMQLYTEGNQKFSTATKKTYVSQARLVPLQEYMLDDYYLDTSNPNCFANWDFTQNMSSSFVVPQAAVKYMNCLNDLRRFETLWDGLRFFDLKRWGIEYSHIYGPDKVEYTLTWNDERRAIEIPATVIQAGLQPSRSTTATGSQSSAKKIPFADFVSDPDEESEGFSFETNKTNNDSYVIKK